MKLKNIIQIGSFVVAGVAPMTSSTASASDYMCLACPAGTYSNGGSTSCTPCPAGTYSGAMSTECRRCEANYWSDSKGVQCLFLDNKSRWEHFKTVSQGKCESFTLEPGAYLVYLRGGLGNGCGGNCSSSTPGADQYGAYVEYMFTVDSQTSAQICAGESTLTGDNIMSHNTFRRGGAGGSWIQIGDKYIVAGGGFGNPGQAGKGGGGGGAIGAGGSGDDWKGSSSSGRGGNGGNKYSGGAAHGGRTCGFRGAGLDGIGGGRGGGDGYESGYDCGRGLGGEVYAHRLFAGYARSGRLGGSATGRLFALASHDSNVNYKLACQDGTRGCSALYKFNNEVK